MKTVIGELPPWPEFRWLGCLLQSSRCVNDQGRDGVRNTRQDPPVCFLLSREAGPFDPVFDLAAAQAAHAGPARTVAA
jgi:hypothetical protein